MPKRMVSFRLDPELVGELDERAEALGLSRGALAERLLREGLATDAHPGVVFSDGPSGRRARLAGTGLDVWLVVDTVRQNAGSVANAAEYLELPPARVEQAVRYYAAHPAEIDAWTARARRAAEQAETEAARARKLTLR